MNKTDRELLKDALELKVQIIYLVKNKKKFYLIRYQK